MGTEHTAAPIDSQDLRRVRAMLDGAIACVAELCNGDDNSSPMLLLGAVRARLHQWEQERWEQERARGDEDPTRR